MSWTDLRHARTIALLRFKTPERAQGTGQRRGPWLHGAGVDLLEVSKRGIWVPVESGDRIGEP
jgi:hypothetical protein